MSLYGGILLTLLCNNSVVLVKEKGILWKIKDAWLNERCVTILKCYTIFSMDMFSYY